MRVTLLHFLITFCVSLVAAQTALGPNPFNVPSTGFAPITAGQPTTLSWKPTTSGTVSLRLRSGANSNLDQGTSIASSIPNTGTYTYTPPADTVRGSSYTIEIIDDGDKTQVNYTPQFVIESKNTVASVSSVSSAISGSATSATSGAPSIKSAATSSSGSAITSPATSSGTTSSTTTDAASSSGSAAASSNSAMVTSTESRASGTQAATGTVATTSAGAKSQGCARGRVGMGLLEVGVGVGVGWMVWGCGRLG